ncbi:uncharacterized protein LOC112588740 [Harpegnathos saltator]|uniref:uncharacterized protein LOC112588740 n=1 Tax=Harpegnathos saltator TaxID=610380 RepID=UPI000DBED6CB|nr:uncharacterized protein LOC112588740 [Harpegnathos saltator]
MDIIRMKRLSRKYFSRTLMDAFIEKSSANDIGSDRNSRNRRVSHSTGAITAHEEQGARMLEDFDEMTVGQYCTIGNRERRKAGLESRKAGIREREKKMQPRTRKREGERDGVREAKR